MDRIAGATDQTGFAKAGIVVEAVVENMAVKQQVLREFETVAGTDAVFASNTSSLSITGMASATITRCGCNLSFCSAPTRLTNSEP